MNKKEKDILDSLLQRAQEFWLKEKLTDQGTDVEKLRYLSVKGFVQGKREHDVLKAYYKTQGLWEDGIITLETREKQLLLEKIKYGKKIRELKNSYEQNIANIEKRIQKQKEKLNALPAKIKEDYRTEAKHLLQSYSNELESYFTILTTDLKNEINDQYVIRIKELKERKDELEKTVVNQFLLLQRKQKQLLENQINEYGAELEAEFLIMESKESDEVLIEKYQNEVKRINQEINDIKDIDLEEKLDLEEHTVAELREIAESKGIELPTRILKAELIEKIEATL